MHRFIPDPASPAPDVVADPAQLAAVKSLVRRLLALPDDTPVMVTDTACADPGCPVLETVVAVFPDGSVPRAWRFARPRATLSRLALAQALATPGETVLAPCPAPAIKPPP